MFCCTLLCVHSSFAIILIGKRELVSLICLSSWCLVSVVWLFLTVPRVCLQFVIVVFPDHTHLLVCLLTHTKLELSENLTIAPLQCLACSKWPMSIRILSWNVIVTSIKGHNSLANLRKITAYNPNVDLVSIDSYIKFGQNLSICSQDIEQKQNFGLNQGQYFWYKL